MKKLLLIAVAVMFVFSMGVPPVFASNSNLEYFDEMSILYKIKSDDLFLKTKHFDIGAEAGILNLGNPFNNFKEETYIAGVISVKEVHLLNRLWAWFTNR